MINPYQKYQESSVQTSTPAQLIVMLYDGAVRFTKQAIADINNKNFESANKNLCKAQSIVNELIASLDHEIELSSSLLKIYDYLLHLLIQSNIYKEIKYAEEALDHMQQLRESWRQLSKQGITPESMPTVINK